MMWPTGSFLEYFDTLPELGRLHRDMDRLFRGYTAAARPFPPVNVWSDEHGSVVTAEVPGVEPESVKVTVKGNVLTLEGERRPDELGEKDIYHRRERGYGQFTRSVRLPYDVNADAVKANYNRGVLRVELPRAEASKPRKIPVAS